MDEIERKARGGDSPAGHVARQRTSRVRRVDDVDDSLLDFAPYVHVAPRRNSITPDKQRRFIAVLAATGIVSHAARSIGASMEALYKLRHRAGAEDFARAWDAAVERGYSRLEDCALERAIAGEERPIVSGGQVVGTWTHHNTALLMFLLRARRPEKFGAVRLADLRPGHAIYESLRAEWLAQWQAEREAQADEVRRSLRARLLDMRDAMLRERARGEGRSVDFGDVDGRGRGQPQGIGDLDHIGDDARLGRSQPFEAGEEGAAGLDEIGGGAFKF
ncbi:hypothetical protein [Novosphingobium meiothermophilum]|uniref:hypothetical protein n=1 Tax=Novosphingobium meiothermophilum TaxID=2202251 RepID=UPI001374DE93|nr:hypothetical protein [Novosphingobium meiothermophilum]